MISKMVHSYIEIRTRTVDNAFADLQNVDLKGLHPGLRRVSTLPHEANSRGMMTNDKCVYFQPKESRHFCETANVCKQLMKALTLKHNSYIKSSQQRQINRQISLARLQCWIRQRKETNAPFSSVLNGLEPCISGISMYIQLI